MSESYDDFYSEENLSTVESYDEHAADEGNTENEGSVNTEGVNTGNAIEEVQAKSYEFNISGMNIIAEDDPDEDEDVLTAEERLRSFADDLMSCCIGDKEIKPYAVDKLIGLATPELFRDENHILYQIFNTYRGKLRKLRIDDEFIRLFLNRNRKIITDSRRFIDINAYGEIDGSAELGYAAGVLKHFIRLKGKEELSEADFDTLLEKYIIEYKTLESSKILSQGQVILTEGMKVGRKSMFGFDDCSSFVRRKMAEIEGVADNSKGTGYSSMRDLLLTPKDKKKFIKISDFGKLSVLNKVYGGIYSGMMYQVMAPNKGGKSKLMARVVHTTAVEYGNNVSVWAKEGGSEAFLAQLRAIHFDYIYNTGVNMTEKRYGVSQEVVLKDEFPSDELRQLEMSSMIDLASNQDYGNVDFIDRPFNVETFIDDLDVSVKSNNSSLVVIDYLQLIASIANKSERERVAEAYKSVLDYCKANNVAVMTPGQYKQEVIDRLSAMSTVSGADLRTAGAVSSEVERTPDIIFALWASVQDLNNNSMKLISVPSRLGRLFPDSDVKVNLEVCQFVSVEE